MPRRRLFVAFLLLASLAAGGFSTGLEVPSGDASLHGTGRDAATGGAAASPVDAAVVRVKLDDRRHAAGQRSSSSNAGLWLVAVLALVAALLPPRRRCRAPDRSVARPRLGWWSPISGRAPPPTPLAVR